MAHEREERDQAASAMLSKIDVSTLIDPPTAPRVEVQPMSADDARTFLDSVQGDRPGPLYRLALVTGLRQGELLAQRWQDVDLDAGMLVVRHTLQRKTLELMEPKTARAQRYVALDAATVIDEDDLEALMPALEGFHARFGRFFRLSEFWTEPWQ